ncbi:MAG: hypothetical protein AAF415_02000 [Pseudomonadota bacterium]
MLGWLSAVLLLSVAIPRFAATFRFALDFLLLIVLLLQIGGQVAIALGQTANEATTTSTVLLGWMVQILIFVLAGLVVKRAVSYRLPGTFSNRAGRIVARPPKQA